MKGAVKVKTVLVIVILLLVGVLGVVGLGAVRTYMAGAAADSGPKDVRAMVSSDGKSATISFTTGKKCQPTVLYGTGPTTMLLSKSAAEEGTDFNITLSPLKDNTLYYYTIKINDTVYDNAGIPYSFSNSVQTKEIVEPTPTVEAVPLVSPVVSPTATDSSSASCNQTTDYNNDGVINSVDYYDCLKGVKVAPTKSTDACVEVDYNKDGVINAVDQLLCRQNSKQ
ncbi:MAG TPA: hypothetical protein P5299_02205 [Candidatus Woesebacteria bacterium]|nr:hypothetical protein [Candidatus Woesebacteria bacterium]HRT40151.1 hypothetical protein [Candidatus Woesebacteria bacterium]